MSNSNSAKRGFTLVETLVVLVIIGVLAALLFPVFARVREDGRKATCQSNLQQIGLAIGQYKADSQGFYPPAFTSAQGKQVNWMDLIDPYVQNRQIFFCPSQPTPYWYEYGNGYINTWGFTPTKVTIFGNHEAMLKAESSTMILYDSTRLLNSKVDNEGRTAAPMEKVYVSASCDVFGPLDRGGAYYLPTVHTDGANYGFADGHVKWFTPQSLIKQYCP